MKKTYTDEQVQVEYEKRKNKAKKLLDDPDKLERILQKLEHKMKKIPL